MRTCETIPSLRHSTDRRRLAAALLLAIPQEYSSSDRGHDAWRSVESLGPGIISQVLSESCPCNFAKYHALGNDYVVLEESESRALTPALARRICDRHLGLGADGILLRLRAGERNCPRLRIFNPDGSQAEKSGNGLRGA